MREGPPPDGPSLLCSSSLQCHAASAVLGGGVRLGRVWSPQSPWAYPHPVAAFLQQGVRVSPPHLPGPEPFPQGWVPHRCVTAPPEQKAIINRRHTFRRLLDAWC